MFGTSNVVIRLSFVYAVYTFPFAGTLSFVHSLFDIESSTPHVYRQKKMVECVWHTVAVAASNTYIYMLQNRCPCVQSTVKCRVLHNFIISRTQTICRLTMNEVSFSPSVYLLWVLHCDTDDAIHSVYIFIHATQTITLRRYQELIECVRRIHDDIAQCKVHGIENYSVVCVGGDMSRPAAGESGICMYSVRPHTTRKFYPPNGSLAYRTEFHLTPINL